MPASKRDLRINMRGADVRLIQDILVNLGYAIKDEEVDSARFGKTTVQTVRAFQKDKGLEVTGEIDSHTLQVLRDTSGDTASGRQKADGHSAFRNLIRSEYGFKTTKDLRDIPLEDIAPLEHSLNDYLHQEILRSIGAISEALSDPLQTIVQKLDHRELQDTDLATIIRDKVLAIVGQEKSLSEEVSTLENRLAALPARKIADVLHLNVPIRENPVFRDDLRRARIAEYATIARLGDALAQELANRPLLLDDMNSIRLNELVREGVIDDDQRRELSFVFELGKLTGDNIAFVLALKTDDRKAITDFIGWDKNHWTRLIETETIPLPPGETKGTVTEKILFNLDVTFPSHVLLNHMGKRRVDLPDSLELLFHNNQPLIDGRELASLDWSGVGARQKTLLEATLPKVISFANTFRHLGISEIINDQDLTIAQKREAIGAQLDLLTRFNNDNPELDLRFANFFDNEKLNWTNIPNKERPKIRKQMMAFQRVLSLASSTEYREVLLNKGFDSASIIASMPESTFVHLSGLPTGAARQTYPQAQQQMLGITNSFAAMHDITRGGFKGLAVSNLDPAMINDLREIDGFDDLFGSQNYCDCDHCRSIFGPAAYFVDLMRFIHGHVSKPVFIDKNLTKSSLYLRNRRSDLWDLQLSCENTNTEIPYLTIVNEILESYLKRLGLTDVYAELAKDYLKISFNLPFNLALEELRTYLGHFEVTLHDIYKLSKQPEEKIWRARLNLSKEEFTVITQKDLVGIRGRFGDPTTWSDFPVNADQERRGIIQFMGITRQQLDELLALRFNHDLQNIKVEAKKSPDELQNFPEILKNLTDNRVDFMHRFLRLWSKTCSSIPEKKRWSISEFDLVLLTLKEAKLIGAGLNPDTVIFVAKLVDLQDTFNLSVEELCALAGQLPVSKDFPKQPNRSIDRRLYERLFDLQKMFGLDANTQNLNETLSFHHYSLNTVNPNDQTVDPNAPLLLGGIGISDTDLLQLLELLKNEITVKSSGDIDLGREQITLLYRHARVASGLEMQVDEFIRTLHLNFPVNDQVITKLDQILALNEFNSWLKLSPFTVFDLCFILEGEESSTVKFNNNLETVSKLVYDFQQAQNSDRAKALETDWIKAQGLSPLAAHSAVQEFLITEQLAKTLNVSTDRLEQMLKWISSDFSGASIQGAFDAKFKAGTSTPVLPNDVEPLLKPIGELERVSLLFNNMNLTEDTVKFMTQSPQVLGISDLKKLTLSNIRALTFYHELAELKEDAELILQNVLKGYQGALSKGEAAQLAGLWDVHESLVNSLNSALPSLAIDALEQISKRLALCEKLGVDGYSLQKLSNDAQYSDLRAASEIALGAFASSYEDETARREKLEPYQDKLNVIKRDTLCDYIIVREKQLKFKDLHDIYAFFLLDVEMSGCFRTSRVVCATQSLQLYIHRILMNLEQSATESFSVLFKMEAYDEKKLKEFKQEWEWRQNYRVWEANRKVFLYPENYILPELRDNKTPIFAELEEELLQEKITEDAAETAYKKYVAQFAELARLRIAGSYYHEDTNIYYFFGRTQQEPPQYYYRRWIAGKEWTPWENIELAIDTDRVSALIYRGRLYLFWVDIKSKKLDDIKGGTSRDVGHEYTFSILFSTLDERRKWSTTQKLTFLKIKADDLDIDQTDLHWNLYLRKACFPYVYDGEIYLLYYSHYTKRIEQEGATFVPEKATNSPVFRELCLFRNEFTQPTWANQPIELSIPYGTPVIKFSEKENKSYDLCLVNSTADYGITEGLLDYQFDKAVLVCRANEDGHEFDAVTESGLIVSSHFKFQYLRPRLIGVSNKPGDQILLLGNQSYLIQWIGSYFYSFDSSNAKSLKELKGDTRTTKRISTSLADDLAETLFAEGLETFLSLATQSKKEYPVSIGFPVPSELPSPYDDPDHIDFKGTYGTYYEELFFHIPFLIASHSNANQNFEVAKWWYERIFDPTSTEMPDPNNPSERNWQFIGFRNLTIPKLQEILTDEEAIKKYEEDPFSPHAIARLRPTAYQKTIVMKYIDNLLDWGEYLFAMDTRESINEATMLFILAADILGKRPVKLGKCQTIDENILTFQAIEDRCVGDESDFLIMLENWCLSASTILLTDKRLTAAVNGMARIPGSGSNVAENASFIPNYDLMSYDTVGVLGNAFVNSLKYWEAAEPTIPSPGVSFVSPASLAFCIPANEDLLKYWDRVETQLFKIRNCMNISGVRRSLSLFQPPIDPMMLVRAKASGLSLDDILKMLSAPPPLYRFTYLIEKAKQFTQTVQNFGGALLSALEKKEVEELNLLRSVHERNILSLTKEVRKQQLKEAQTQCQSALESKTNVQNRIDHYQELIDGKLTVWETIQQAALHTGTSFMVLEGVNRILAAISYLIPQVGSPFAMKYGGKETGDSTHAWAEWFGTMASVANAISASAGLEATFQRREEEWSHQLKLVQQELKQAEQQIIAAEIRKDIAEKELAIHDKNIEQAKEMYDFYKNKFTNLGLYNYLSTTLNRLYREAYNVAYDLAKMAEQAYRLERDDDQAFFVAEDNWHYDRAGLLAGERLLLQLQQLEKAYIENNQRDFEVTQPFSLTILNSEALHKLKHEGTCEFTIAEVLFDLFYPGQYDRRIKSVRITIPCVTGPYANVGAKLTWQKSWLRTRNELNDPKSAIPLQNFKPSCESIVTSSAQNDAGVLDFNFRDERYLPFEGAGAVSAWQLQLPRTLRMFDYSSIADVVVHISYTAKEEGTYRGKVEEAIQGNLTKLAADKGLFRLFSLRHEFPDALHRLLNPTPDTDFQKCEFVVTNTHFPYFLVQSTLDITETKIYLMPKRGKVVETTDLHLEVNGSPKVSNWPSWEDQDGKDTGLKVGECDFSGDPVRTWTLNAGTKGLDKDQLEDILILVTYKI